MAMRKIVLIDAERCDGCGQCVSACAEGAIKLIDGKARLVKDEYCDGLGACLGECPQGAISIIERQAAEFDEAAVEVHLHGECPPVAPTAPTPAPGAHPSPAHKPAGGCPGSLMRQFAAKPTATPAAGAPSALRQWPVQLHLVSPTAPYFQGAELLLAADCAAFACGDFHARFMTDRAIAIACPKLDDPDGYVQKLAAMITDAGLTGITIVMMQVPCCRGLQRLVEQALAVAGIDLPVRQVILSLEGEVLLDTAA